MAQEADGAALRDLRGGSKTHLMKLVDALVKGLAHAHLLGRAQFDDLSDRDEIEAPQRASEPFDTLARS
jgi:hypothetical protein